MNYKSKTGVLLVNLGTPDSPKPADVKKYLLEFLMDERVIDFPWLKRNLLVRGIIVPFRYKKSAKLYKEIWDEKSGSPLLKNTVDLTQKVRSNLPEHFVVEMAMRYQNPSIEKGLLKLRSAEVEEIIVVPLFPQYASSSTGSTIQKVMEVVSQWNGVPAIKFTKSFYDHPGFVDSFIARIQEFDLLKYDHVIFSYHGLPESHMKNVDETGQHCLQKNYNCCKEICGANRLCYRAQCKATTDLLVAKLSLDKSKYTMSFQSRLGKEPWIQPFTDLEIKRLAKEGKKKLLVVSPAFVADCLETIYEIGIEYQELFQKYGGQKVQLVESLNAADYWVNALVSMIKNG